jgi:RNA-directed DNA polymerase
LDIKDFFHTIKQNELLHVISAIGIGALPARTLSELCTFKAFVPQGAITSPKVSNIITARTFGPWSKPIVMAKD